MKKKFLALALSLTMVLGLAACGGGSDNASSDGAQSLSLPMFKEVQRHLNKLIGRIDYDNKLEKAEREKAALK